jgi:L-aspartate oxidase
MVAAPASRRIERLAVPWAHRLMAVHRVEIAADFLVVGSGIAGLSFALRAAKRGLVIVLSKRARGESNTAAAQGGIAAVLDPDDSFEEHVRDTEVAGAGLCRHDVVELVVRDAPERIDELVARGVRFAKTFGGGWDLGIEGGHSHRRVVHAGDITGREIARALVEVASADRNIRFFEEHAVIDLITTKKVKRGAPNKVLGCYALNTATGDVHVFRAKIVVLATGGSGKVYLYTTNPNVATGDGVAMAYRAGCPIANMEFMQFHPTCLFHPEAQNFLISEAVRGEGGVLRTMDGTAFMERYHPMKDLAPRDVVARAIDAELKGRGDDYVLLDITHKPGGFVKSRFPSLWKTCKRFGVDMTTDAIPVVPAAHYQCGGVPTDLWGETGIRNLFAVGEVACTGLHGANRLASNSLLEGAVFGVRAAARAAERVRGASRVAGPLPCWDPGTAVDPNDAVVVAHNWDEVRRTLWNYVGIVRTDKRLARAKARIDLLLAEIAEYYWNFKVTRDLIELRNIALVGDLVIRSAMRRRESRGLHYTLDYPETLDDWKRDTLIPSPAR